MNKEFNFTPINCDNDKFLYLLKDSRYKNFDLYLKVDNEICHIIYKKCEDKTSDYNYIFNGDSYNSFRDFINNAKVNEKLLNDFTEYEILEINNDGPQYHHVFCVDSFIKREVVTQDFTSETKNVDSVLKFTFSKPAHTWIVLENLLYLVILIISTIYSLYSLINDGNNFFNIAILAIVVVLGYYCFKDYFKYKVEIYSDKVVFPNLDLKEFSLNFKTLKEFKYSEIETISYVKNPKPGKSGKELVLITHDGAERIISLNVLSKNQYLDLVSRLIECIEEYHSN